MTELFIFFGIVMVLLTLMFAFIYKIFADYNDVVGKKVCIFCYLFSVLLLILFCIGIAFLDSLQ